MELFVLRHGQAEPWASTDADRRLTREGVRKLNTQLARCRAALTGLEAIWVSPLVRARQTADRVIQALGASAPPVDEQPGLEPGGRLAALYEQLQTCQTQSLMLVSHQPLVGTLVNDLCGCEPGYHPMGTASLAYIELDIAASGLGQLRWLRHTE